MSDNYEIKALKAVLKRFRDEQKILLAYLFGSYASGEQHARSDIDLALYLNCKDKECDEIIDTVLMSTDRQIEILRLDDEDESPFIVQKALKGTPLVEPDIATLYQVANRALHEAESLRFRRMPASVI